MRNTRQSKLNATRMQRHTITNKYSLFRYVVNGKRLEIHLELTLVLQCHVINHKGNWLGTDFR